MELSIVYDIVYAILFSPYFLGTVSEFKRKFENPILQSRDADASDAQQKKGEEKLAEVRIRKTFQKIPFSLRFFPWLL